MPTPPAEISLAGAAIARCAGEDKFFAVIDDLFEHQGELIESARNPWRLQKNLRELGARHGLNVDQVGTCMDDKAIDEVTRKHAARSARLRHRNPGLPDRRQPMSSRPSRPSPPPSTPNSQSRPAAPAAPAPK